MSGSSKLWSKPGLCLQRFQIPFLLWWYPRPNPSFRCLSRAGSLQALPNPVFFGLWTSAFLFPQQKGHSRLHPLLTLRLGKTPGNSCVVEEVSFCWLQGYRSLYCGHSGHFFRTCPGPGLTINAEGADELYPENPHTLLSASICPAHLSWPGARRTSRPILGWSQLCHSARRVLSIEIFPTSLMFPLNVWTLRR